MSGHLLRRIWNALSWGSINLVNDAGPAQTAQVGFGGARDGQILDGVPVLQLFGFSSNSPVGSDAAVLFFGGDASQGIVIATGHQASRPTGQQPGESRIYNANISSYIYMSNNGIIINGGGKPVQIVNADLHASGAVIAGYGGTDQVGLQTHDHEQDADSHGDSEAATKPPTPGT